MVNKQETYDHERVHFNLGKLRKGGDVFEIAIDPDLAIAFKNKEDVDIKEVLKSEKIFHDVSKGELASETRLKALFNTDDVNEIAKIIIAQGEIQFTQEHRQKLMDEKKKKIVTIIAQNAIDPKTKLPHPRQRIENALDQVKVKYDFYKKAEDQVEDIVKILQPILPIEFETKKIELRIPGNFAGKCSGVVRRFGKILNEEWRSDGSLVVIVEMPAGLAPELFDELNGLTHGSVESRSLE